MPQECLITYLPRGFRSRNRHNSAAAGRQSWNQTSQASANPSKDAIAATLPSPSEQVRTLPNNDVSGATRHNGPLSPSESRDDNDDTRSYQTMDTAGASRLDDSAVAENTSLTTLGPRMLLSSHGERGMSPHVTISSISDGIYLFCSLRRSCCLDSIPRNRKASRSRADRAVELFT